MLKDGSKMKKADLNLQCQECGGEEFRKQKYGDICNKCNAMLQFHSIDARKIDWINGKYAIIFSYNGEDLGIWEIKSIQFSNAIDQFNLKAINLVYSKNDKK